jgi:hypothetical protein
MIIYLVILTFFVISSANDNSKSLVEIPISEKTINDHLFFLNQNEIDIAGFDLKTQKAQLLVNEHEISILISSGFNPKIIYKNANIELRKDIFGNNSVKQIDEDKWMVLDSTLGPYHTYTEITNELNFLASSYPALAKLDTIGLSIENRIIWGIKISDNVSVYEPDEPEVLYIGNHHARELISVEIPMDLIHQLLENYTTNSRIQNIVDNRQIWIIPMLNPDGHVYVENTDLNWRKNRRNNNDGTYGIDLNRNYGYMWGYDNIGSSPNTSAYNYRGTAAFSEPEIDAIRNFIENHFFSVCFTYHAYGSHYIYPWNYINDITPDHPVFENLAIRFSSLNNYDYGNSLGTINYYMNGEATDWMYGEDITKPPIFALTVEVGNGNDGFIPDTNRIQPLIEQNREANLLLAEFADNPYQIVPLVPQPEFKSITRINGDSILIQWNPINDGALRGYRLYSYIGNAWTVVLDENTLTQNVHEIAVPIQSEIFFKLNAVDTSLISGLSYESDIYGASIFNSDSSVLIVDGFDRYSGSWTRISHPFVQKTGKAITAHQYDFESCSNEALLDGSVSLMDYPYVVWILGDESTIDSTLTPTEQNLIQSFLEGGGKLFISGSEIGWDLVERGSQQDINFYNNYLKANYIEDNSGILSVSGNDFTIFTGLSFTYGDPSQGAPYQEDYPDVIGSYNGSKSCLKYSGSLKQAGIQYEGFFGGSNYPAKLVYFAFPFETINSQAGRNAVMERVLAFFDFPFTNISDESNQVLYQFSLDQNYPNPFNSTTTIQFSIPVASKVILKIFDLNGCELETLNIGDYKPGKYSIKWHAEKFASGIYFYQINTTGTSRHFSKTRKLLLIK